MLFRDLILKLFEADKSQHLEQPFIYFLNI